MQKAKTYDILHSQILTQVSLLGDTLINVSEIMKSKIIIDQLFNVFFLTPQEVLITTDTDFLVFSESVSFQFSGEKVNSCFTFVFPT